MRKQTELPDAGGPDSHTERTDRTSTLQPSASRENVLSSIIFKSVVEIGLCPPSRGFEVEQKAVKREEERRKRDRLDCRPACVNFYKELKFI